MSEKSCGCLIGSAVIGLEIKRRKNALRIEEIDKEISKKPKNLKYGIKYKKKIEMLKKEKARLLKSLKEVESHKKNMKSRFDDYIKESGYVPPRFKNNKKE